jgi:hypothetical protein
VGRSTSVGVKRTAETLKPLNNKKVEGRRLTVSIVPDNELDDRAIEVRSPAEAEMNFPLTSVSRPALGPT